MTHEELRQSWGSLENSLRRDMALPPEGRCDYSGLFYSQCAHCQGHEAWWESEGKKIEVYGE